MIPFDFQYCVPETIQEAVSAFQSYDEQKLSPIFYGGGTEIISQARKENLSTKAVIDLKDIPECKEHEERNGQLVFGSAITLTEIIQKNLFPFLSRVCRPIADRTIRNKITLGGNICGRLPYREAILPFMLIDTQVVIAGSEGIREVPISQAFNKRLLLKKGEFLVQLKIPKDSISLLYFNRRREKQTSVDYPIVHVAAVKYRDELRASFSGVSALPFRSQEIEGILYNRQLSIEDRILRAIDNLPLPIKEDQWASKEYRRVLFKKALFEMFAELEGVEV